MIFGQNYNKLFNFKISQEILKRIHLDKIFDNFEINKTT